MKKENVLFGIGGLAIGLILAFVTATTAINTNNQAAMNMLGMNRQTAESGMNSMSMNDMTNSLKGKTGDEFDKVFISDMIVHHQGAIDMALLAKNQAGHDEIKTLADEIINAQTKEINEMKTWQEAWGYEDGLRMNHGGH